ncbi:hypothetical protein DPMN_131828 [Dreissena polymorpha]|uniref:Uncharacterized protein n=1 Tax=Dreissena polymorpha TaxID=45954 RepID=A0A9D4FTW6_DREPO|nr:hypothetical protein DPMN_131828 [Dreissena polymorpha]
MLIYVHDWSVRYMLMYLEWYRYIKCGEHPCLKGVVYVQHTASSRIERSDVRTPGGVLWNPGPFHRPGSGGCTA